MTQSTNEPYPAHAKYGAGRAIMCDENRIVQIPGDDIIAMGKEFHQLLEENRLLKQLRDADALASDPTYIVQQGMKKLKEENKRR